MRKSDLDKAVNACCCKIHDASAYMPDDEALKNKELIPSLDDCLGKTRDKGFRFREGDKLWKTKQPKYTFVDFQRPSLPGFESLFEEIPDKHSGTKEDPIPYEGNMELEKGKFYFQNGLYECIRDTINPVYDTLKALATVQGGEYVKEISE